MKTTVKPIENDLKLISKYNKRLLELKTKVSILEKKLLKTQKTNLEKRRELEELLSDITKLI